MKEKYKILTMESWAVVFGTMKQELIAKYPSMWIEAAFNGLENRIEISFKPVQGQTQTVFIPGFGVSTDDDTPSSVMKKYHQVMQEAAAI